MTQNNGDQYIWRDGTRNGGVKAADAHREFQRVRERDGGLAVSVLVNEARPEDAVLHPALTWDDSIAAEEWRKNEMRQIVRAVIVQPAEKEKPAQPVYVHVPEPRGEGRYQPVTVVVQDVDMYQRAYGEVERHLAAAERAVREMQDAAKDGPHADRLATIGIAIAGFQAVREALALLRE